MNNVIIGKATNDVSDCIRFANVRKELITKTFTLGGTSNKTRDIDKLHRRWQYAFRRDDTGQCVEPGIRDGYDANVRFDRTERIVFSGNLSFGQRVEQCGLAHIG